MTDPNRPSSDPTRPASDQLPSPRDLVPAPADEPGGPSRPDDAAAEPAPLSTFSLEGRSVPALYLIGWVGTVMGLGVLLVSMLAGGSGAARWLTLAGLVVLGVGLVSAAGSQAVERGRHPTLAYRGVSPVLAFVVAIALTIVGILVVLAPLSALGLDAGSPLATAISLVVTMLAYVAVIRVLVVGPGALTWSEMGVRRPDARAVREVAIGALFALPVLVVTLALSILLGAFLEPSASPLPASGNAAGLALNLLSAAIIAPVGEELFFRGFATTAWARSLGRAWPAVVRGAAFFAFAHVLTVFDSSFLVGAQRALFSFVALLPVGVTLGWLFLSRRSLYASVGLHGTFNAIQVVLAFVAAGAVIR